MAAEWRGTTVGEACEVYDGPHATPKKTDSGPVFLGISSLRSGRIELSESEHLSEEDFVKWTRRVTPREGDLVFSYETRLGEAALIPEGLRCCLGRRMGLLRPRNGKTDPEFLLYYYLGPEFQEVIRQRTIHGSTVDRLALIELPNFPLRLPPLPEQKAIAAVLGALDDKIECNRRMNATLEAMAMAMFQSWFVDFDPVRANAEGHPTAGLDALTAEFQDSELGEIPQGWGVRSLYETARFINGAAFKSEDFCSVEEGLPVIKIVELKDGIGPQTKFSLRQLTPNQMVEAGDLLYSWSGSPETSLDAFVWTGRRGLINQHIFKVVTQSMSTTRFAYYLLRQLRAKLVDIARNKQTTGLGHVTVADMKRLLVCHPPDEILAAFDSVIAPLYDRSFANDLENRTLANLRDTLLPKLLSGELDISGIERGRV